MTSLSWRFTIENIFRNFAASFGNIEQQMESKKVLFISQEITPYLPESEISLIGRNLPQGIQDKGKEIRTFMPRFGCINERRNQLHEVIRLSGMNLIIDDTDHPLIIKVASIQAARMQVYFIDNDEYFQRKSMLKDTKGILCKDNDERVIFFARGVIETVKKLQWAPDLIHCQGWFTSLVPLYIKKFYHDDPLFMDSSVVTSIYDYDFQGSLDNRMIQKLVWDGIDIKDMEVIKTPNYINLIKLAIKFSDGLIMGSEKISGDVQQFASKSDLPILEYQPENEYVEAYSDFYDKILSEVVDGAK